MGNANEFATALRYLRNQVGMTQAKLGELAGVSQRHVSALETAARQGHETTRRGVADVLSWDYEGMLDLGRRLIGGENPDDAVARARALFSQTPPPPILAPAPNDLEGFRVHRGLKATSNVLWVSRQSLGNLPRKRLVAYDLAGPPRVVALVNEGATGFRAGQLYLLNAPLRLRIGTKTGDAWLLKGLAGETEAASKPWADMVRGRVLWYQVNTGLADRERLG